MELMKQSFARVDSRAEGGCECLRFIYTGVGLVYALFMSYRLHFHQTLVARFTHPDSDTHPAREQRLVLLHAKWWQKTTYERSTVNNHLSMQDESTSTQNASSLDTYSIELRDVTKRFLTPSGKVFTAIRDIKMAVDTGEIVAVVG